MKAKRNSSARSGLTLIEIVLCIFVLCIVVLVFLPLVPHTHRAPRISCVNNEKQIALAFIIFANDHDSLFPTQFELFQNNESQTARATNQYVTHIFQVMSNELSVPNTAICPADARVAATNWNSFSITNISYFVGLDVDDTKPNMILSGDRDIAENGRLLSGTANLTTNRPVAWHRLLHKEGGNLLFADGSVQQVDTIQLRERLSPTGDATNRVLFPQ